MKRKLFCFVNVLIVATLIYSCGALKPSSFVKSDVIAKRFEMDMISKDGGYGRTNWIYTWNTKGKYTSKYRTCVIFKFSSDRTKVDIKTEAEFGGDPNWIKGYDTRLLATIKQDIMGVIGRTTL